MNNNDRLTQLQIQQLEQNLKDFKSEKKSKSLSRFASGMKYTGHQLVKLVKPTKTITQKENFNMMFGMPKGLAGKRPITMQDQNRGIFVPDQRLKNQNHGLGKKPARFI